MFLKRNSFFLSLFTAESASIGQHRKAGKVITETGGRLSDCSRNRYVLCYGLEKSGVVVGEIAMRMSEQQQIVLLTHEVGGCMCVLEGWVVCREDF